MKLKDDHIKTLTFPGWESLQDWDRDISEAIDREYNPEATQIPDEFNGTIHVVITYEPNEKENMNVQI